MQALVAGVNVIARRVEELVDRYGADVLGAARGRLSRLRRAPPARRAAPDPAGHATGAASPSTATGWRPGAPSRSVATVTIGEGEVTVDFTGTAAQSGGAINASFSQTLSGVIYAIRCFVDPSIPMNEGCFRLIHTGAAGRARSVNPDPPAACGGRMVTVAAVVEAILAALSGALPERAVAASALIHVYTLSGVHPDGGAMAHARLRVRRHRRPPVAWTDPTPPAPTSSVGGRSSPRSNRWRHSSRLWSNGAR